jgi:alpha-glucosidase
MIHNLIKTIGVFVILLSFQVTIFAQSNQLSSKDITIYSPDKKTEVIISIGESIQYSFNHNHKKIVAPSKISLNQIKNPVIKTVEETTIQDVIEPRYGIRSSILNHFTQCCIEFTQAISLEVRVYNDGWAYRFRTHLQDNKILIEDETFRANFQDDFALFASWQEDNTLITSYEQYYSKQQLLECPTDKVSVLPVVVDAYHNVKVGITEANVYDYPAMYIVKGGKNTNQLCGLFPRYPTKFELGGHKKFLKVPSHRDFYMAKTDGERAYPWRVFIIADSEAELLASDLVYRLSEPEDPDMDFSWVKPGKVAWDWWSNLNITGVDFKVGFNTETYKHYIDFAADYGIEYINIDEGWYQNYDLTDIVDDIDFDELMAYAKQKDVGVIIWCIGRLLEDQLEEAMDQFTRWGVQGLKVDFFDRDDQVMMNTLEMLAREAAKRKLLVNFHGVTKPTGLHRKYPNVINREGVKGLEYNKFSDDYVTPGHSVTIPFTRMLAGPMDFTPGAMNNVPKTSYHQDFDLTMSHGTRCQQLAMYVVYYAPLQMLCGSPTAYRKDSDTMDFLQAVPTVWDETVPLDGKIGEYAVVARRSGDDWFIGGMTNQPRELEIDFSFLDDGTYQADIYHDGTNAHRNGIDYKRIQQEVNNKSKLEFQLVEGGGVAIRVTK